MRQNLSYLHSMTLCVTFSVERSNVILVPLTKVSVVKSKMASVIYAINRVKKSSAVIV